MWKKGEVIYEKKMIKKTMALTLCVSMAIGCIVTSDNVYANNNTKKYSKEFIIKDEEKKSEVSDYIIKTKSITHIYAYDKYGNFLSCAGINVNM